MYFVNNTVEEVEAKIAARIRRAEALAQAWRAVTIEKKRDGKEFSQLGRALRGAKAGAYYPNEDWAHPYITVVTKAGAEYTQDEIPAYFYADEVSEEKRNTREYLAKGISYVRDTLRKTPDDLREAIKERAAYYEQEAENLCRQKEKAREIFNTYRTMIAEAEEFIEEADKQFKNKPYFSTLYYETTRTR